MSDLEKRIAALQSRFRERLSTEREWLEAIVADARLNGRIDDRLLNELTVRTHQLAGIAGSLGYPQISLAAASLEGTLREEAGWPVTLSACENLLASLRDP